MQEQTDRELLEEFAASQSEAAFRALVDRHLDLVHSVARRVTCNDDLARDVAQMVFLKLATKPGSVPKDIRLLAWLHRTTRHKAIDLVRSENRRRRREEIATQQQQDMEPELDWKELEPVIDEALAKLSKNERTLILARYYERRSHRSTAEELGISEDAARMRTARALEKLRRVLKKRGVATTAALLGTAVAANAVTSAPPALASSICTAAASSIASGAATTTGILAVAKAHVAVVAAVAIGVPIIALQYAQNTKLDDKITKLESEIVALKESDVVPKKHATDVSPENPESETESNAADAEQSLDEILAQRDPLARLRGLLAYVDRIGAESIPDVFAKLRQSTPEWDPDARIASQLLLTRWGSSDPEGAIAYIEKLDYKESANALPTVIAALAAKDPKRAAEWLQDPDNKMAYLPWLNAALAGTITKEWVRHDPDAALEWASTLPEKQRSGAYSGVLGSLAATDPTRASALALDLEPGQARRDVIGQIVGSWGEQAPREAMTWVLSELQGDDLTEGITQTLSSWAIATPREAAEFYEQLPDNAREGRYLRTVASMWARQEPSQAAAWVAAQPEDAGKADAMGHVMWNWTVADPQAASTWLIDQPESPSRDHAIGALAKATFDTDPAAAVTWAAAITDEARRAQTLERGLRNWVRQDADAARRWVQESGVITLDEMHRLLGASAEEKK